MESWARPRGIDYLDGAIMNYPVDIGKPEGTVLYSGPDELFNRVKPVLLAFGDNAMFVGKEIGQASATDVPGLSFAMGVGLRVAPGVLEAVGNAEIVIVNLNNYESTKDLIQPYGIVLRQRRSLIAQLKFRIFQESRKFPPQCEGVLASLAEGAGGQCNRLRCLDLAANIVEKRRGCFLTQDMAHRSRQRFAASFCIDGKQFVHLSHNRGCNRISGI